MDANRQSPNSNFNLMKFLNICFSRFQNDLGDCVNYAYHATEIVPFLSAKKTNMA